MLKILSTESAEPRKGRVGVGGDSKARRCQNEIDENRMDGVEVDSGQVEVDEVGKKVQNSFKFKKTVRSLDFLTLGAKLAFTELRWVFNKAPILYHFDPECHI